MAWNLFHGRDRPPDEALRSRRLRVLGGRASNETHVKVNRPLLPEFTATLAADPWHVALLQEAPPRWLRPLARGCAAHGASALTSRNFGAFLRTFVAERNPGIIASNEGGSNQILVRPPWRIADVRRLTLTFAPERRRMIWARLEHPDGASLAVATLHSTAADTDAAARDAELAAERSLAWAGDIPLVLGGDFNLRPASEPEPFALLHERYGLGPPTGPKRIDHVLARGLDVLEPPQVLPASWREQSDSGGRLIRLSDHDGVAAVLGVK